MTTISQAYRKTMTKPRKCPRTLPLLLISSKTWVSDFVSTCLAKHLHIFVLLDLSFKQAKQALMIATLPQQKNIGTQSKMKVQSCKEGYNINDPKKVIKEMTECNAIVQDAVEFLVTAENWEDIESLEVAEKAMEEAVVVFDDHQLVATK